MGDMNVELVVAQALGMLGKITIEEIWSAALGATALLSTHLAGERRRSAWVVGMISQAGWFGFMFVTSNFGFLVSFIGFSFVYIRNHRKWSKPATGQNTDKPTPDSSPDEVATVGFTTEPPALADSTDIPAPRPGHEAPAQPRCRCRELATAAA